MSATDLKPSTLDELFKGYQEKIIDLWERYENIYNLIASKSYITELKLFNVSGKPCVPRYRDLHLSLLDLDLDDTNLQVYLDRYFYGFTRTRVQFASTTSPACQWIPHQVDFNHPVEVLKVYEEGVYKVICNKSNTYYLVSGTDLTVNIDGNIYTGDIFEFAVLPEFGEVVVTSPNDIEVQAYSISVLNEEFTTTIEIDFTGFNELTFKSYIDLPVKAVINNSTTFYILPNENKVYKLKYYFNNGDEIKVSHLIESESDKQFAGVICCARRWQL